MSTPPFQPEPPQPGSFPPPPPGGHPYQQPGPYPPAGVAFPPAGGFPPPGGFPPAGPYQQAVAPNPPKRPVHKQPWLWIVAAAAAVAVVVGVVFATGGGGDEPAATDAASQPTTSSAPSPTGSADRTSDPAPDGSSASTPQTAPTNGSQLGSPVAFTGDEGQGTLTVNSVAESPGDRFLQPDKGKFLVINVTVVATRGTVSVSSFNFRVQLDNGQVVNTTYSGDADQLDSGDIEAGQNMTGTISFDVAAERTASAVQMEIDFLGNKRVTVRLA